MLYTKDIQNDKKDGGGKGNHLTLLTAHMSKYLRL